MHIASFKDMYIAELQELCNAETQLAELLPGMAQAASNAELKSALTNHWQETKSQKDRLESLLRKHNADPKAHIDQAMQALVSESQKMASMVAGGLRDAVLIASAQKLEHYEIAAYGTAAALAGQLNLRDDQKILHGTLEEEKSADAVLTKLAKGEINRGAAAA
jgi:ferritin-like metal-binding protein YciE